MKEKMVLTTGPERKHYVRNMFNNIAHRYDLLNHLLSGGVDILWRKKTVRWMDVAEQDFVLDLACGTGDLAIEITEQKGCRVIGADIALRMLRFGQGKNRKRSLNGRISFVNGDGEMLPFRDGSFKAVTIAFGIRNMGEVDQALREMWRVLKPGGQAMILEFSLPTFTPFRKIYLFYFKHILPRIGRLISKDTSAYSYLPASVEKFPTIDEFSRQLIQNGFDRVDYKKLMNGVAVIYRATKER